MSLKVAALYQFLPLPDYRHLRAPLRALCDDLGIKGTLLLAAEGINGTLAGSDEAIDALIDELRTGALFGGRLDNLELKFSRAETMPFKRMKVRLKKEIVTLGDQAGDPASRVGTYVEPADWNALIARPGDACDRHPQRLRGGDGQLRRRGRSEAHALRRISGLRRARTRSRAGTARWRCSAPAASAARRRAPICSRRALPRSITSRAAS